MATVYEATHIVLPRRAAIKVMHGELLGQPGMTTRMVQEAAILEGVRHPGVVRVYDCSLLPDHRPWLAMELVEGETLASRLKNGPAFAAADVAMLVSDVADVLAAVHAFGVVHRDIKPDNLLCTPRDRDYPLRVLDWGVARLGMMCRLTLDGLTPGTPIYMSPEQATGRNIAPPCDIYSLGIIAYEALTGYPPFDGRTVSEVVRMHLSRKPAPLRARCNAPDELCGLVEAMLEKDPALRPCAIEVRQVGRAIAQELSPAQEKFEQSRRAADDAPGAPRRRRVRSTHTTVDADALEHGVTEMLPVVPKPRWTPEVGGVPALTADQNHSAIAPRMPRDRVTGEMVLLDKPH